MEGADWTHPSGSGQGSTTAADVGAEGSDRDTLGGCAVGKRWGWGKCIRAQGGGPASGWSAWGGKREGKLGQRGAATTEDTEGRDM